VTAVVHPVHGRRLPPGKPKLRGWSHLIAAFLAIPFAALLVARTAGDIPRAGSMALYGGVTILLFFGSAAYHMGHWRGRLRYAVRCLDHGNIFLKIAGTVTAIGFNVLDGWERIALLGLVWGFAGAGIAMIFRTVKTSRWVRVGLYVGTGLTGLIALPRLLAALPIEATWTILLGGALYGLGALIYAARGPNLFPRVFEHHELFHVFVIGGVVAFGAVVWIWVVPFSRV
jgi:hemolysin III